MLADDRTLQIWSSSTGKDLKCLSLDVEAHALSLSPNGSKIALACKDESILVYSLPDLNPLVRMNTGGILRESNSVAFLSSDRLLVDHDSELLEYCLYFSVWLAEAQRLFLPAERRCPNDLIGYSSHHFDSSLVGRFSSRSMRRTRKRSSVASRRFAAARASNSWRASRSAARASLARF